jgi:transcriptional regulator with XRE-family HTH domain
MSSYDRHMWAETLPIPSVHAMGRAIRRQRRALRLSQKKLGEATGVAPLAISRLELEGDESTPFGVVARVVTALGLDIELRPRGSTFTPRPPTELTELGLSPNTMSALQAERIKDIAQLDSASAMLARPEFRSGLELYEIVCALTRYGLSLRMPRTGRVPNDREREIFRLRTVDGLTLDEIAQIYSVHKDRIRQLLGVFGLSGSPPAASQRRQEQSRKHTASSDAPKPRT